MEQTEVCLLVLALPALRHSLYVCKSGIPFTQSVRPPTLHLFLVMPVLRSHSRLRTEKAELNAALCMRHIQLPEIAWLGTYAITQTLTTFIRSCQASSDSNKLLPNMSSFIGPCWTLPNSVNFGTLTSSRRVRYKRHAAGSYTQSQTSLKCF